MSRIRRGAIGILGDDSRYLMIRRAESVIKGGCWCFPGGHVEPGETSRDAVIRELREELGLIVEPTCRLGSIRLPERGYLLVAWLVRRVDGRMEPSPREIAEVRWIDLDEVGAMAPGLASNVDVESMLRARIEESENEPHSCS